MAANTFLPTGTGRPVTRSWPGSVTARTPPSSGPGRIVHGGCVTDLPPDVAAERLHQEVIAACRVQFTVPADLKDLHLEVFHNDLSTHTADGSWDLPIPATFVIDRSGIVRARYVSADYTTRMDPAYIEAALAALK